MASLVLAFGGARRVARLIAGTAAPVRNVFMFAALRVIRMSLANDIAGCVLCGVAADLGGSPSHARPCPNVRRLYAGLAHAHV